MATASDTKPHWLLPVEETQSATANPTHARTHLFAPAALPYQPMQLALFKTWKEATPRITLISFGSAVQTDAYPNPEA